ncbi:MAG: DNA repair protein RecO [Sumerlaeia bacterium]
MPPVVFRALVLGSHAFSESSEMVKLLTAEYGRITLVAKGLKRPKSRHAGILQPLATVEVSGFLRDESAETVLLKEAVFLEERASLRRDLKRLALGALVAETASASCEIGQESPELMAVAEETLAALETCSGEDVQTAAALGLLKTLAWAGYEPFLDEALLRPVGGAEKPRAFWMDLSEGRVHLEGRQPAGPIDWPHFPPEKARQMPLPPEAVRFLYDSHRGMVRSELASLGAAHGAQLIDALARLAAMHLETPLHSHRFWRGMEKRSAP